jgi:hypothetical protein
MQSKYKISKNRKTICAFDFSYALFGFSYALIAKIAILTISTKNGTFDRLDQPLEVPYKKTAYLVDEIFQRIRICAIIEIPTIGST